MQSELEGTVGDEGWDSRCRRVLSEWKGYFGEEGEESELKGCSRQFETFRRRLHSMPLVGEGWLSQASSSSRRLASLSGIAASWHRPGSTREETETRSC